MTPQHPSATFLFFPFRSILLSVYEQHPPKRQSAAIGPWSAAVLLLLIAARKYTAGRINSALPPQRTRSERTTVSL